ELSSLGRPCVAHRVCPMPHCTVPLAPPASFIFSSSRAIRPTDRMILGELASMIARPHESYPRYSSRLRPSTSTLETSREPIYPTIPHMLPPVPFVLRRCHDCRPLRARVKQPAAPASESHV